MCGRITQYRSRRHYAEGIGWQENRVEKADDLPPRYNVSPGTRPWIMHQLDGKRHIDNVHWGYVSKWAKEKGLSMAINATIEKAATPYWRPLWKSGRVIVPADGWFEWTGEKGNKQPWYIRLRADKPMFMAALAKLKPDHEENGFVIVTAQAQGGLIDVHDRRPVVLAPEDAALWMDPDLPREQAEYLARSIALGPDAFEWYQVSKEVNRAGNNHPHLIEPLPSA